MRGLRKILALLIGNGKKSLIKHWTLQHVFFIRLLKFTYSQQLLCSFYKILIIALCKKEESLNLQFFYFIYTISQTIIFCKKRFMVIKNSTNYFGEWLPKTRIKTIIENFNWSIKLYLSLIRNSSVLKCFGCKCSIMDWVIFFISILV